MNTPASTAPASKRPLDAPELKQLAATTEPAAAAEACACGLHRATAWESITRGYYIDHRVRLLDPALVTGQT